MTSRATSLLKGRPWPIATSASQSVASVTLFLLQKTRKWVLGERENVLHSPINLFECGYSIDWNLLARIRHIRRSPLTFAVEYVEGEGVDRRYRSCL